MATDFEHGGLKWVIDEINESLKQARVHFESFVEDDEDSSQLQFCTTYLHQVSGSLNMLELGGAALLSEEMEQLSQAIYDDKVVRREDSFEVLMRALIQLPDYLERLERGARDLPMVLLPLLNDLRASRGAQLLTEGALFSADLSLDKISPEPDNGIDPGLLAKKIRHHFHLGLLGWYRDSNSLASLNKARKVIAKLKETAKTANYYQLFSLLEAFIEGMMDKGIEPSASTKLLLGQADRYIKQLIDSGESTDGFSEENEQDLLSLKKNLLFYIAHSKNPDNLPDGPLVEAVKQTYHLADIIPDEEELEDAKASMGGANAELMQAVTDVIASDLNYVKEQLDVYVRNYREEDSPLENEQQQDDLRAITTVMSQISDTLAMLGQNAPRNVLQEKVELLKAIIDGDEEPKREALDEVASALLFVESSLANMGQGGLFFSSEDESVDLSQMEITDQEKQQLSNSVISESKTELQKIKEGIVAVIDGHGEGESDEVLHKHIDAVSKGLMNISGVLDMLDKEQGSQIVKDCADFVANKLLVNNALPSKEQQQYLADTITAIEYYLDAILEQQQDLSIIESVALSGINKLFGRETEQAEEESELTQALFTWMEDVSITSSREKLLNIIGSVAEQVKLLQHDKAEDIAHQMKSMISLVGNNQSSLNDDIASTLRWATETLNRIIQTATDKPSGAEPKAEQTSVQTGDSAPQDASETASADSDETASGEPEADIELDDVQALNEVEHLETSAEPELQEQDGTTEEDKERSSSTAEPEGETGETGTPPSVQADDPANEYPDIKKLETSDDIDPEIMEIFIEEAQEEIEKISELFPRWRENPEEMDLLKEIRRSFHTLKGSGRLVGAYEMGEFAWAYENMLNRIIDNSIVVNELLQQTIDSGIEMLPEIINAFEQQRLSEVESSRLAAYAHILSKGESFDISWLSGEVAEPEAEQENAALDTVQTEAETEAETASEPEQAAEPEAEAQDEEALDPVLLEIFSNEAAGHIENIEQYIEQCHQHNDVCYPDDILIRSLHTLRGSAHMADIHAIGNVSELMEKVVKAIVEKGQKIDAPLIALLTETTRFCSDSLEHLKTSKSLPQENTSLEQQIAEVLEQVKHLENLLEDEEEIDESISISEQRMDESEPEQQGDVQEKTGQYDDELLEIFIEEGEELLDSSEQALNTLKADYKDQEALNRLLRDMHTLKGGARMAGVMAIGDLTHSFESKLEQFTNGDIGFAPEHMEVLQTVQDYLSTMLERLKSGQPVEESPELIRQLDSISNIEIPESEHDAVNAEQEAKQQDADSEPDQPETESHDSITEETVSEYDDELLEIFLEEAQELMDSSDASLAYLKDNPDDAGRLKELLRDLHTLKGGARMAGIDPISDLTHSLESQLEQITEQNQSPAPVFFDLLYQAHDAVSEMLDDLKAGKPVQANEPLLARAQAIARGEIEVLEEPGEDVDASPDVPAKQDTTEESPATEHQETLDSEANIEAELEIKDDAEAELVNADETGDDETIELEQTIQGSEPEQEEPEVLPEQGADQRRKTERVRVSADLLDELVNYAGEVSIYRSRLDQGNTEYQTALEEMNTTIIRLREQLRRFEMETEAQIQSRRDQAESLGYERYEEFDPLEFDRFSNMQQITRAMAETVADLDSIENSMANLNSEAETLLIQQGRVNTDLQEGLMRTRMVPFKSQLPRFRRIVRQTAQELNKKVNFELFGETQEIDRRVLEKIMAPLEHMLRNAIAHGIETPEQRLAAGKPETGHLKLVIGRDGSEIEIKVIDDGAGIDIEAVRRKAIEHGLMVENSNLNDNDIMRFIIESGFSTATEVSQIAGRGVGMDVVNNEIKQLNGTLEITSEPGKGSVFDIHMPLTMSVSRALMVQVGEEIFAIPLVGIENIIRESHDVLEKLTASPNTWYQWHDEQYQFMHLGTALGINKPSLPGEKNKSPILLARSGEHRVALFVDALMGSREIVVKSVGPQLSTVKGVTGATILGDGKIALILDLGVLAREGAAMQSVAEQGIEVPTLDSKVTTVMVVDDSITVRKVTQRLLQRHDYDVVTAKDGVDAIAMLHESIPDVMLLDVEMPRMDGYELATHMRDDENFQNIPIIMITSRTGDKHRERAMKIGVNEYMGKPYQENDLISNIKKLTGA